MPSPYTIALILDGILPCICARHLVLCLCFQSPCKFNLKKLNVPSPNTYLSQNRVEYVILVLLGSVIQQMNARSSSHSKQQAQGSECSSQRAHGQEHGSSISASCLAWGHQTQGWSSHWTGQEWEGSTSWTGKGTQTQPHNQGANSKGD